MYERQADTIADYDDYTICLATLFVLVNFAEPSENCHTRFERKHKRKNCSCSIPIKQLPKNCIEIRKEICKVTLVIEETYAQN